MKNNTTYEATRQIDSNDMRAHFQGVGKLSAVLSVSASNPEQQLVTLMKRIEQTWQVPGEEEIGSLNGRYRADIESLIEKLREDGDSGYLKAQKVLLNKYPHIQRYFATEPEQEEGHKWGKYKPLTLLELAQRPRPSDIIEDIFYEQTVAQLFGAAGSKKSFLAFDWFAHIAMNMPWQEHAIKKTGLCVYTLAEGADSFIKRAFAWCSYYHVPLEELSKRLILVEREIPLSSPAEINEYIADVGEFLHNVKPVAVAFDTLMRCSGGENINAPDVMATLYDGANRIRRELDVSHALIVHHEGKDSTKGSAGSFVMRANCDIVHRLTCDETTGSLTLSCNPAAGGKMKDKAEYPDIYLNTRPVYYTEEPTKDDSSLVIITGEKPVKTVKLTPNRQSLLDALPQDSGLRFTDWKQAVDMTRETDGLTPMAKQTFIDSKDWLIAQEMVRKVGTETGTEQNTYWRVQRVEE